VVIHDAQTQVDPQLQAALNHRVQIPAAMQVVETRVGGQILGLMREEVATTLDLAAAVVAVPGEAIHAQAANAVADVTETIVMTVPVHTAPKFLAAILRQFRSVMRWPKATNRCDHSVT
jgi:hypothetical protein